MLQTVIVSTKTGLDIRGVLREEHADGLVLAAASVLGDENGQSVWKSLPGEVVIPASNVDYYQRALPPEVLDMLKEPR